MNISYVIKIIFTAEFLRFFNLMQNSFIYFFHIIYLQT